MLFLSFLNIKTKQRLSELKTRNPTCRRHKSLGFRNSLTKYW